MATEPLNDPTTTEQRQLPRDVGQALHERTKQDVLDYLPQLTNFVLRELRIQEGFGAIRPREIQPEEVIDAVVLEALERGASRPAGQATFPWLRGLARTVIQRQLANTQERRRWESEDVEDLDRLLSPDVETDEGASGRPQPLMSADAEDTVGLTLDERAVAAEFRATVLRILHELPTELVEPLLLRVRDQRPVEEVARLEGIDAPEVERRVAEAERLLREQLQREYDDLEGVPAVEALLQAVEQETLSDAELQRLAERLGAADTQQKGAP